MRILDIGSGWGGFLRFAAERYGVEGVGITISKEQAAYAEAHRGALPVETRLMDYMALDGQFDRVISIGMFEHVGYKNYRATSRRCEALLRPDGLFLLHTIGNDFSTTHADPWMREVHLPQRHAALASARSARPSSDLFVMEDWHNFGADYDRTLMAWWANFEAAWPALERPLRRALLPHVAALPAGAAPPRSGPATTSCGRSCSRPRGVPGGYQSIR